MLLTVVLWFLLRVTQLVHNTWKCLKPLIFFIRDKMASRGYGSSWSMVDCMSMLPKLPHHVVLVIDGPKVEAPRLAELIIALIELRVSHISVHASNVKWAEMSTVKQQLETKLAVGLYFVTHQGVLFTDDHSAGDDTVISIDVRHTTAALSKPPHPADVVLDLIDGSTRDALISSAITAARKSGETLCLPDALAKCADCAIVMSWRQTLCGAPYSLVSDAETVFMQPLQFTSAASVSRAMKRFSQCVQRKGR